MSTEAYDHLPQKELVRMAFGQEDEGIATDMVKAAVRRATNATQLQEISDMVAREAMEVVNRAIASPEHNDIPLDTRLGAAVDYFMRWVRLFALTPTKVMSLSLADTLTSSDEAMNATPTELTLALWNGAIRNGATILGGSSFGFMLDLEEKARLSALVKSDASTATEIGAFVVETFAKQDRMLLHSFGMDSQGDVSSVHRRMRLTPGGFYIDPTLLSEDEVGEFGPPFLDLNPWTRISQAARA